MCGALFLDLFAQNAFSFKLIVFKIVLKQVVQEPLNYILVTHYKTIPVSCKPLICCNTERIHVYLLCLQISSHAACVQTQI